MLPGIFGDLRHALRTLRKSPGFTLTAILTLALGIGANSAIFNVVNALLIASLPVAHPERLLEISTLDPKDAKHGLSIPALQSIAARADSFSGLFGWIGGGMQNLELNGTPTAGSVDQISGDYYQVLGIRPALGRLIARDDTGVAVLGYSAWQRFYHGSADVLGQIVLIDGKPYTIVGVHPKSFTGLIREVEANATIPVTAMDRKSSYYTVIGRVRDTVDPALARAQLQTIWPSVREQTAPESAPEHDAFLARRIQEEPAAQGVSYLRERFTRPLYALSVIVGILLLLACVNLANVALARAHGRAAEYRIRAALGAGRWRLAQASLAESVLLAILGAIPGFAFAVWSSRYLADFMWTGYGRMALSLEPDLRIVLFTTAVASLAAILFGFIPALRAGREFRQDSGARVSGSLGRAGQVLVTAQIALSFAIVCAALLFSRSLVNFLRHDLGFASDRLLVAQLFPRTSYTGIDKPAYFRQLLRALQEIPGVASASIENGRPIGFIWKRTVLPINVTADFRLVAPGYFDTLGMRILRGRDFDINDSEGHPKVAVVSASLAHLLSGDPIGQRVKIGDPAAKFDEFEIVGITGDATRDPHASNLPSVYAAIFQQPKFLGYNGAVLRASGDPALLSQALRRQIESLGREYPLQIEMVRDELNRSLTPERTLALLAGFFGALALLLAAIGLYGLLSYSVSRRTPEIGIRVALGATRGGIAWMMVREVAVLLGIGLAVGLAIALAGARAATALLYGLTSHDPSTIALAAGAMIVVALLASLIPSTRAASIDPAQALRRE
jgi:putative ABC transport system permease protein